MGAIFSRFIGAGVAIIAGKYALDTIKSQENYQVKDQWVRERNNVAANLQLSVAQMQNNLYDPSTPANKSMLNMRKFLMLDVAGPLEDFMAYINNFKQIIIGSALPIGLAATSLAFAFPEVIGPLGRALSSGAGKAGPGIFGIIGLIGKALFHGASKFTGLFGKVLTNAFKSPTGGMAVLAACGLGLYFLNQLYKQWTGTGEMKLIKFTGEPWNNNNL